MDIYLTLWIIIIYLSIYHLPSVYLVTWFVPALAIGSSFCWLLQLLGIPQNISLSYSQFHYIKKLSHKNEFPIFLASEIVQHVYTKEQEIFGPHYNFVYHNLCPKKWSGT